MVPSVSVTAWFNISNNCNYTVWPGISSGVGSAALDTTGFQLSPGQWKIVAVPSGWSGRVWGRTLCFTDSGGRFRCVTGDCGSGMQECAGGNAAPPVTLSQFTVDDGGSGGMDSHDVSLVDGFNLPMMVVPYQLGAAATGNNNCAPTGCVVDLNGACPPELRVTSAVAGAMACQYCCTGEYGNPNTCTPSVYSELFKHTCPRALSYAYDDTRSSSTCGGGGGGDTIDTITFCPSTASAKSSTNPNSQPPATGSLPPHIDDGTTPPYTGGSQQEQEGGVTTASTPWRIVLIVGVMGVVTAALGVLAQFLLGLFKLCCNQSSAAGAAG